MSLATPVLGCALGAVMATAAVVVGVRNDNPRDAILRPNLSDSSSLSAGVVHKLPVRTVEAVAYPPPPATIQNVLVRGLTRGEAFAAVLRSLGTGPHRDLIILVASNGDILVATRLEQLRRYWTPLLDSARWLDQCHISDEGGLQYLAASVFNRFVLGKSWHRQFVFLISRSDPDPTPSDEGQAVLRGLGLDEAHELQQSAEAGYRVHVHVYNYERTNCASPAGDFVLLPTNIVPGLREQLLSTGIGLGSFGG